jgi:hypothetical protein
MDRLAESALDEEGLALSNTRERARQKEDRGLDNEF